MINLFSTLHLVLREAGYTTSLASFDRFSIVCFEDDVLTGFGYVFDDPGTLIRQWKATEMSFLTRYAPSLRAAGEKAWNVYCVFLCSSPATPDENRQVHWIEENLDRTRKVAACGIATRDDLMRALLPLLPLQYQPLLRPEDITERLRNRIHIISPSASDIVLDESIEPEEAVRLLGGIV